MKLAARCKAISSSATLDITARAKSMAKSGIDVINFGAGEPDFDTPSHIKDAAIVSIKEGFTKYTPSSGTNELREAIAKKFERENSLHYEPAAVVVSCGAKHSLCNIFLALCEEGDEVIIPSPYWLSYPEMVKLASAKPVFVKTQPENNFKLTKKLLTKAITKNTKAIIINSPSNPTGSAYSKDELEMIADIATSKNICVISDEIYEKLIYDGLKHVSIASLGEDIFKLAVVVNGVSKTYSMTGWRIGYAAGPLQLMKAISNIQSHSTSNPTSISQRAALAALNGPQTSVGEMLEEFRKRRDYILSRIQKIKKLSCVKPQGAFYVFCDASKIMKDSVALATKLLEEAHVAVVPGDAFGGAGYIRLSFATSMDAIKKGLDRIEQWAKQ